MSFDKDLFFFHDDNTVFYDYTRQSRDYLRESFSFDFESANDFIYIGLYKPFYSLFYELSAAKVGSGEISLSYWNGSTWSSISNVDDDTVNLSRSGFLGWGRELEDWEASPINGEKKYWIRVSVDADITLNVKGFNLVFSNDIDLSSEQRDIDQFRAKNDLSFIAYHVSARDEIVQKIRNSGKFKRANNAAKYFDITKWDFNSIDQIRQASKYLALSKIMFDVSTETDDKYYQKFQDYTGEFSECFRVYLLSLDSDDDGIEDSNENANFRVLSVRKV